MDSLTPAEAGSTSLVTEVSFRRARSGAKRETLKDVGLRVASVLALVFVWWILTLFFPPMNWNWVVSSGPAIRLGPQLKLRI